VYAWTGRAGVLLPDGLLELAADKCLAGAFARGDGPPLARVEWLAAADAPALPHALNGYHGPLGSFDVDAGAGLARVRLDGTQDSAVAALRLGWNLATEACGGLLVHASGVAFGDRAVLAVGESGAGKSTFARLCLEAGATLLSDEILGLYPDGTCAGTPFRSDLPRAGQPGPFRAAAVLTLQKGDEERLLPVVPQAFMQACLGQAFPGVTTGHGETFRRLAAFLAHAEARTFWFRKSPDVGAFIRDWLGSLPRP